MKRIKQLQYFHRASSEKIRWMNTLLTNYENRAREVHRDLPHVCCRNVTKDRLRESEWSLHQWIWRNCIVLLRYPDTHYAFVLFDDSDNPRSLGIFSKCRKTIHWKCIDDWMTLYETPTEKWRCLKALAWETARPAQLHATPYKYQCTMGESVGSL